MMNEPTGWSADCDHWACNVTAEQDDHVDGPDDWADTLQQWGWIVVGDDTFHSLDCLIAHRAIPGRRKHMGDLISIHARFFHVGTNCCPQHGKHMADGTHDWQCPKRYRRRLGGI